MRDNSGAIFFTLDLLMIKFQLFLKPVTVRFFYIYHVSAWLQADWSALDSRLQRPGTQSRFQQGTQIFGNGAHLPNLKRFESEAYHLCLLDQSYTAQEPSKCNVNLANTI
jgi:hypothetical protein